MKWDYGVTFVYLKWVLCQKHESRAGTSNSSVSKLFSPSGEEPEQRIYVHKWEQPTADCIAIFHKYCCYIKHRGIITHLNMPDPYSYVKMPRRGCVEHIQKHIAPLVVCSGHTMGCKYLSLPSPWYLIPTQGSSNVLSTREEYNMAIYGLRFVTLVFHITKCVPFINWKKRSFEQITIWRIYHIRNKTLPNITSWKVAINMHYTSYNARTAVIE